MRPDTKAARDIFESADAYLAASESVCGVEISHEFRRVYPALLDYVEELERENTRLKAERDDAVAAMSRMCGDA